LRAETVLRPGCQVRFAGLQRCLGFGVRAAFGVDALDCVSSNVNAVARMRVPLGRDFGEVGAELAFSANRSPSFAQSL